MKFDEQTNNSSSGSAANTENANTKKASRPLSASTSNERSASLSDKLLDLRDGIADRVSRVFKPRRKSEGEDEADFPRAEYYDDILSEFDRDVNEAPAEAAAPKIVADLSEYFDGTLSREDEQRFFAAASPKKPEKLDLSSPVLRSAAKTDIDDPEFDELRVPESRKVKKEELSFKERFNNNMNKFWKFWTYARIPVIIVASLLIVATLLIKVGNKIYRNYIMPVDPNDSTPIVVTIPTGSGASEIAKILYEAGGEGQKGLISHKAVFKVYVDFIGKSSRLQAGTYVLSKNMSIPDIVNTICLGVPPKQVKKIQITEGMTVEVIAEKLVADGIIENSDHFLELCRTGEAFVDSYPFLKEIPEDPTGERPYALEGFLFPATYEVYFDANEETIIDKMLSRFDKIYGPIYTARTKQLNMTMYEVITLASTVEKEAKLKDDFGRVAAVFYNRLNRNMNLASDATLEYVLKTGSLKLTEEQLATPSGYNTHTNYGLPIGPVSNPGDAAINAVLYPNEEYVNDAYLYFCLMNPESGALAFARTVEEHNANIAKYSPLW